MFLQSNKISYSKMPTILIDKKSLLGGIASDIIGISASQETKSNQYAFSNGIDLYRAGRKGHITPAQIFNQGPITDASSNINSVPRAAVVDITQTPPYIFTILGGLAGTAPRVVRILSGAYDSHQVVTADAGDNFTTLPATGFWGEDIILYKVGAVTFVFYSWNDSDDGDVGQATLAGVYNDDYMSTVAASGTKLVGAVPHRMVEGADKNLYITNGRYVAQFDGATGANGTLNATKYDSGVGWINVDVRRFGDLLVIAAIKSGSSYSAYNFYSECRVCFWNMTEPGLGLVKEINDNYLSAIFATPNNELFAFTRGKNDTTKIHEFTGSGFRLIWEGLVGTYGTPPDPRSIEYYKGLICWVPQNAQSSFVLALDPETKGVHIPFIVNDGTNNVTASSAGVLRNIDVGKLYVGGLFSSSYKLVWLTATSTGFASSADLRTQLYSLPFGSTIKKFKVFFSQMVSGSQAQFSLFTNYTASSVGTAGTDLWNETLDFTTYGALNEYEFAKTIPNVSSFYLNVRVTGQISVRAIVVEYQ